MTKPRILVADPLAPDALSILGEQADVDQRYELTHERLVEIIGDYDALVVRSRTKVTADVIRAGRRLKVIGRAGVGLDSIDVDSARAQGIAVVNSPEAVTVAVAEHTLGLMLCLARQIPYADAALRRGEWLKSALLGSELMGKTLGIVGLGRIGSAVSQRAGAFGMLVIAHDPYLSAEQIRERGAEPVSMGELLSQSDYISIHVPLTPETEGLIGRHHLAMLKPNARLVCCARGKVVDEAALIAALDEGRLAGVALDVFAVEPLPADSPLLRSNKVVVTPHIGANTVEGQAAVGFDTARRVLALLHGDHPSVAPPPGSFLRKGFERGRDWTDPGQLQLRIVPLRTISLHEQYDPLRVDRLATLLRKDQTLYNPVLVTRIPGMQQYVVLDGAARVSALCELGCRDGLVQIIDYTDPSIGVGRWHHLLRGIPAESFLDDIQQIPQVRLERATLADAERALALREICCILVFADGQVRGVHAGTDLAAQIEVINAVVGLYRGKAEVFRLAARRADRLWVEGESFNIALIFPAFTPEEVLKMARNGARLPMGITRHIVPGRALGLGVSLDLLRADVPLDEKNARLQHLVRTRIQQKKVRLYQEPVFVFDE